MDNGQCEANAEPACQTSAAFAAGDADADADLYTGRAGTQRLPKHDCRRLNIAFLILDNTLLNE